MSVRTSFRALTEEEALNVLHWRPEDQLDACVARFVEDADGQHLSASEARWQQDATAFHLHAASERSRWPPLALEPGESQQADLERLLASWPRR